MHVFFPSKIKVVLLFLLGILIFSCEEDKNENCPDNEEFCFYIDMGDFNSVIPVINDFLETLEEDAPHENLVYLQDWMECKSCVDDVEITCNSCIYTSPPQSELTIVFYSGETRVEKIMDVLMDSTLTVVAFHD